MFLEDGLSTVPFVTVVPCAECSGLSEEDFNTDFTSAMLMVGRNLANNRNIVKKKPIEYMYTPISCMVGENITQLDGR
jgi:hypothetical protein